MSAFEDQVESDVLAAATKLAIATPDLAKGLGKSYEAWLYLRIAAGIDGSVTACDHQGNPTSILILRGGPGYMATAQSTKANAAGFFSVANYSGSLELHSSLRHRGTSEASHEIDISLNRAEECWTVRLGGGGPYPGPPVIGLELKHYGSHTKLDKNFARALLGVAMDLNPWFGIRTISARGPGKALAARTLPVRGRYGLVTTASLSPETARFLKTYAISAYPDFSPQSRRRVAGLIRRIQNLIDNL
ncbi:hypothetical protein [Brevundimonas sp.]|uniref:hypothetical protein n=1 Tax=Brevundimonas sp. TaxID=1871086 RepID=UPI003566B6A9